MGRVHGKCSTEGCEQLEVCKGICHKCYLQRYRTGQILTLAELEAKREARARKQAVNFNPARADNEIERAREAYAAAVGVAALIYWRNRIRELGQ